MIDSAQHDCGATLSSFYRIDPLATIASHVLKLRVPKNLAKFLFWQKNFFVNFNADLFLGPAICGVITVTEADNFYILNFDASRRKRFSMFIAMCYKKQMPKVQLRITLTEAGVTVMKTDSESFTLETLPRFNTALVLGIKTYDEAFKLDCKFENKTHSFNWEKNTGFDCHTEYKLIDETKKNQNSGSTVCSNCGKGHTLNDCVNPYYTVHCTGCLVVSLDAHNHSTPCRPMNKVSLLRSSLLAEKAVKLFDLEYDKDEELYYLADGTFQAITSKTKLISAPAECVFVRSEKEKLFVLSMLQTSFKRCSILIAVFDKGVWRLRFIAVVTPNDGLLVFPVHSRLMYTYDGKLVLPEKYQNSTTLLLGINTEKSNIYMRFVVYAGDTYSGYIGLDLSDPLITATIEKSLENTYVTKNIKFNRSIYKPEPWVESCSGRKRAAEPTETKYLETMQCSILYQNIFIICVFNKLFPRRTDDKSDDDWESNSGSKRENGVPKPAESEPTAGKSHEKQEQSETKPMTSPAVDADDDNDDVGDLANDFNGRSIQQVGQIFFFSIFIML